MIHNRQAVKSLREEWNRVESNGVEWSGVELGGGVEWDGMGRCGVGWQLFERGAKRRA